MIMNLSMTSNDDNKQVHPEVMLTDTVGFIQKLPTNLVAAFRATLEEVNHDVPFFFTTKVNRFQTKICQRREKTF